MKDKGLDRSLVQEFETSKKGIPTKGNKWGFRKMFWDYLNKLEVPFNDICCVDASDNPSPVRFNTTTGSLEYFNGSAWVEANSGAGASATSITAFAGGGQTSATQLTAGYNEVTTVATDGDSVKLPSATVSTVVIVKNDGANSVNVFPYSGDTINDGTVDVAIPIAPQATVTFYAVNSTNWETSTQVVGIASGTVGAPSYTFNADPDTGLYLIGANNIGVAAGGSKIIDVGVTGVAVTGTLGYTTKLTHGVTTGITAFAGGGQASATALTTDENIVTTVATAGDSVKLPTAVAGYDITVSNQGATALDIFPASGNSINALAVNLAVRIQPKSTARFIAKDTTVWVSNVDKSLTLNSPTTVKGQLEILAADSAGNTVTTVTNASQAAARTYTIPDAGANANFLMSQGAQTIAGVQTYSAGQVMGLINTYAARTGLTALAGGAQAGTALTTEFNEFTTVATAADSAQLPVAVLGKKVIVKNSAAKAMAVFGQTGDAIDGAATNASFTIQPGQEVVFEALSGTTWGTLQGTSLGTISSVTQGTSITTGVTVNSKKGIITTFTPSTAALSATTFTVTCNKTTATSNIRAYVTEYGGTVLTNGLPYVFVKNQTATSFDIVIYNAHATNALSTSMKIGFEIIN